MHTFWTLLLGWWAFMLLWALVLPYGPGALLAAGWLAVCCFGRMLYRRQVP